MQLNKKSLVLLSVISYLSWVAMPTYADENTFTLKVPVKITGYKSPKPLRVLCRASSIGIPSLVYRYSSPIQLVNGSYQGVLTVVFDNVTINPNGEWNCRFHNEMDIDSPFSAPDVDKSKTQTHQVIGKF